MRKKVKKLYSINYALFIISFLAVLVITSVTIIIFAKIDKDNTKEYIGNAIIGLLSGALASVIISFFIEFGNCQRKNRLLHKSFNDDIETLKFWITELIQSMYDSLEVEKSEKKLNFDKIYHCFVSQLKSNESINALDDKYVSVYVNINLVTATVDQLTTGEEKEYLLKVYDNVYSFQKLVGSLNALENNLFNNGKYDYEFIYTGIFDFLSTIVAFAKLVDQEFGKS